VKLRKSGKSQQPRIAVVVKNTSIQRSQSILLMIDFLRRQEWDITLVLESAGRLPRSVQEGVSIIDIPASRFAKAAVLLRLRASGAFHLAIAFDPHAFRLASRVIQMRKIVYYSLELYFKHNTFNLIYPAMLADFERLNINQIAGLIIQSEERRKLFFEEYGVRPNLPTFLLPVCSCARSVEARVIPRELAPLGSRTILHFGGLSVNYGTPSFCESVSMIHGWQLLLHGHDPEQLLEKLQSKVADGDYKNVRISEEYLETVEDAERLCGEVDVGLAWYRGNLSPNYDTAALSSGKIATYLKYGLPLIVRKYGSFVDVLERSGCAVAIESPEELPCALERIETNYRSMSRFAYGKFVSWYDFGKYERSLADFIVYALDEKRRDA
jgi:glycosyltransferase involved in cell wall biosynthesis